MGARCLVQTLDLTHTEMRATELGAPASPGVQSLARDPKGQSTQQPTSYYKSRNTSTGTKCKAFANASIPSWAGFHELSSPIGHPKLKRKLQHLHVERARRPQGQSASQQSSDCRNHLLQDCATSTKAPVFSRLWIAPESQYLERSLGDPTLSTTAAECQWGHGARFPGAERTTAKLTSQGS